MGAPASARDPARSAPFGRAARSPRAAAVDLGPRVVGVPEGFLARGFARRPGRLRRPALLASVSSGGAGPFPSSRRAATRPGDADADPRGTHPSARDRDPPPSSSSSSLGGESRGRRSAADATAEKGDASSSASRAAATDGARAVAETANAETPRRGRAAEPPPSPTPAPSPSSRTSRTSRASSSSSSAPLPRALPIWEHKPGAPPRQYAVARGGVVRLFTEEEDAARRGRRYHFGDEARGVSGLRPDGDEDGDGTTARGTTARGSNDALARLRARIRRSSRRLETRLRDALLPASDAVTEDYWEYARFRFFQRAASSGITVFATQQMLTAVGLGATRRLPAAAAVNWVLKDGLGRLGKLSVATNFGRAFDADVKRFRFTSSVVYDLSSLIEMITPFYPQRFLLLATIANVGKSVGITTANVVRAPIQRSFALEENLAEIAAKTSAQQVLADNVGLAFAVGLTAFTNGGKMAEAYPTLRTALPLAAFVPLAAVDLYCIYRELKAVNLKTVNKERGEIIAEAFVRDGRVPTPRRVADAERLLIPARLDESALPLKIASVADACPTPEILIAALARRGAGTGSGSGSGTSGAGSGTSGSGSGTSGASASEREASTNTTAGGRTTIPPGGDSSDASSPPSPGWGPLGAFRRRRRRRRDAADVSKASAEGSGGSGAESPAAPARARRSYVLTYFPPAPSRRRSLYALGRDVASALFSDRRHYSKRGGLNGGATGGVKGHAYLALEKSAPGSETMRALLQVAHLRRLPFRPDLTPEEAREWALAESDARAARDEAKFRTQMDEEGWQSGKMLLSSAERAPYVLEEELTEEKLLGGEDFWGRVLRDGDEDGGGEGGRGKKDA